MLDVDHFKKVNDSYGHLIGDRALQTCVTTIQNILHPHDLLGRFGGEEFAILFLTRLKKLLLNLQKEYALKLVSNQYMFMANYLFLYRSVLVLAYILQTTTDLLKACLKKQMTHSIKQSAKDVTEFYFFVIF